MSLTQVAAAAVERAPIPDALTRLGVGYLVARARRRLRAGSPGIDATFAADMPGRPIAENTADANAQHYEVPADFFRLVLGPRLKYSSCYYEDATATLAEAEERALAETCAHAGLADGQSVMELGCGWGSLSLWMAEHFPNSTITSVSNSRSQRSAIEAAAKARGLANLTVITADMNVFQSPARYDRIVSVEMFEHMSNWRGLLERVAGWLAPDGRLFLHVFTHIDRPYRFEAADRDDWIAQHFFTGGIMPSHGLIRQFPDLFEVEVEWRWSGEHYRRTANDWLANFDRNTAAIAAVLKGAYGRDADLWRRRWRLFFLATAGLFGDKGGEVWGVSHYRLKAATSAA
ncbi:MAG: cyclopropane-fatty-acyl-phospholipid synthase family protein [Pseudomonadota bacterium]|nr:cyclopropane-fatty-acyl-phospholipid synthase family protein [Pseudomonadota bacterium]